MNEEALKQFYRALGIGDDFIELHKTKNLSSAKEIIEGYDFGRKIADEEKRALLVSILGHSRFTQSIPHNLSKLIRTLDSKGVLTEQEIYGAIIKFGVNGGIDYFSHSDVISNSQRAEEFAEHCEKKKKEANINDEKFSLLNVTKTMIQRAIADNLSEEQAKKFKKELEEIGVSREYIDSKNIRNLYSAKQIVEGYDFKRDLTNEEKSALIICLVKHSHLNERRKARRYLSTTMQNLEEAGFDEQKRYGIIINTAINKSIVEMPGCGMTELLNSKRKVLGLKEHATEIDSKVTEDTIRKAQEKANRVMAKTVKALGEQGDLALIDETKENLDLLTRRADLAHEEIEE